MWFFAPAKVLLCKLFLITLIAIYLKEVQIESYEGPKKPAMPDIEAVQRNSNAQIVSNCIETTAKFVAVEISTSSTKSPTAPKHMNI